jgi:hypothetical protein
MKPVYILRSAFLGVIVLSAAADAFALNLGRARSLAILGLPLELTIPVEFDVSEESSGPCFDADVFFGDTKLDSAQVSVVAKTADQQPMYVRIVSRTRIDEPVVTVYLRAGCAQKITRRYVLLADLATEISTPSDSQNIRTHAAVAIAVPNSTVPKPVAAPGALKSEVVSAVKPVKPNQPSKTTLPQTKADSDVKALRSANVLTPRRSQLKLVPLDLTLERDPVLKLSDVLTSLPEENAQRRGESSALWRSLNLSAQDVLQADARLLSLETDLKAQRDLTKKNGESLKEFAVRLEEVETKKYSNPLVYALVTLLSILALVLAFSWSRLRAMKTGALPWWSGESASEDVGVGDVAANRSDVGIKSGNLGQEDLARLAMPNYAPTGRVSEVDIDLDLGESVFSGVGKAQVHAVSDPVQPEQNAAGAAMRKSRDFSHSVTDGLRSMNMQEMLDVRQQADFFMTLGQYDEAITMLANSIDESGESNPLVYLDLLKAFYTLSRKSDYDRYRADFNARFSGRVPDYTGFSQGGKDLESYREVMEHISSVWPSQEAVDYIESILVRSSGDGSAQEFDLNAFRDLLTLHEVVSRILSTSESSPAPFSTAKIDLPSNSSASEEFFPEVFLPDATQSVSDRPEMSGGASQFAVDLDLSDGADNLIDFDLKGMSEPSHTPSRDVQS